MNSKKAMALALVLAFTGSAMAAGNTYMSHEADDVQVVQQHTVFVELVLESDDVDGIDEIHEFGAVVGLVKECVMRGEGQQFDNAVLWFNDQFLFGTKNSTGGGDHHVPNDALGEQPPPREYDQKGQTEGEPGFLDAHELKERWGGCFIPSGFMHGISASAPYGTGSLSQTEGDAPGDTNLAPSGSEMVKQLIDLDNDCFGCIFEYEATFYITDPNNNRWMVDKLVYPVSLGGDLFASGGGEDCYDGSGISPVPDPRSTGVHADECEDDHANKSSTDPGEDNHRSHDGTGDEQTVEPVVEPIYTVHLQVDPSTGTGFADEAKWAYETGEIRDGAPYPTKGDTTWDLCKEEHMRKEARPCAIEYNFLLAMDFAAFNSTTGTYQQDNVRHGEGEDWNTHQGDSHPHNPDGETNEDGDLKESDRGPEHHHSTVNVDLFFYEESPYFVTQHEYWDENGAPPEVDSECEEAIDASEEQQDAVKNRAVMVCDTTSRHGDFHAHDGSQTIH